MNWEAIGAVGEVVGAIAVLATLLYIVAQIRLSNRIAIASSETSIRSSFGQLNEAIFGNTEFATIMSKAKNPDVEFDEIEITKFQAWLRQGLNMWLSIETAYKNGTVPEETYGVIFDDMRFLIDGHPGTRPIMRELVDFYPALSSTELFTFINELLAKYET